MRFMRGRPDARILVAYEIEDQHRKLIVSDNGIGKDAADAVEGTRGFGPRSSRRSCASSMLAKTVAASRLAFRV